MDRPRPVSPARWALIAALAAASQAPGQVFSPENAPTAQGSAQESYEDVLARELAARLAGDLGAVSALTGRILKSSIAELLTKAAADAQAARDVADWIRAHPLDAGYLAAGFAKDDAEGTHEFEKALFERVKRHVEMSPGRYRGLYGRLHALADASRRKLLDGADPGAAADEPLSSDEDPAPGRERLRDAPAGVRGAASAYSGGAPMGDAFERLARADAGALSSHEMLSIQSRLNQERPPWAPRLLESGQADYDTARFPGYALRDGLDSARAELADELRNAPPGPLDPAFARRLVALSMGEEFLRGFESAAKTARDLPAVPPGTLRRLARLRRNAMRWTEVARRESELMSLSSRLGFLDADLRRAIAAAPAPEPVKTRYLGRGKVLSLELDRAVAGLGAFIRWLSRQAPSPAPPAKPADAARLATEIDLYRDIPTRLLSLGMPASGLRALIERWVLRLAPNSSWGRRLAAEADRRQALLDEFERAAYVAPPPPRAAASR